MSVFKTLTEGGIFTLPFLLHIYNDSTDLYYINDNEDLTYNSVTYTAAAFQVQLGANGETTLETSLFDKTALHNHVLSERTFPCEIVGVYLDDEVVELETYSHIYGQATWDEEKFQIKLNSDDRGDMTFPALIYNSYNNRGAS